MPTVTGDVKRIAGTTVTSGEVRFTATTPVVQDPDGNTTSLATSVAEHVVTLDGSGAFSTTLPATGDTWVYRVEISAHVGANKVQGLPRLLLEVPAAGADLSDAGVEGAQSGRVVVNRLVGRTELTAALAPIDAKATNAVATVERLDTDVTLLKERDSLAPGQVVDQETAIVLNDPASESNAVLNAQSVQAGEGVFAKVGDIPDNVVQSLDVADVRVVENPPASDPALSRVLYIAPVLAPYMTDFGAGVSEITPRWRDTATWTSEPSLLVREWVGAGTATARTAFALHGAGQARNAEVLTLGRVAATPSTSPGYHTGALLRGNGDLATSGGLVGSLTYDADGLASYVIAQFNGIGGSYSPATVRLPALDQGSGALIYNRFRVWDDMAYGKAWMFGTPEPEEWQAATAVTWLSGGFIGGYITAQNRQEYDMMSVSYAQEKAPSLR